MDVVCTEAQGSVTSMKVQGCCCLAVLTTFGIVDIPMGSSMQLGVVNPTVKCLAMAKNDFGQEQTGGAHW